MKRGGMAHFSPSGPGVMFSISKTRFMSPTMGRWGQGCGRGPFQDLVSNACCSVAADVIPQLLFQSPAYTQSHTSRAELLGHDWKTIGINYRYYSNLVIFDRFLYRIRGVVNW